MDDLCCAAKDGSEMRASHSLDTHRKRHKDLSGDRERISKTASLGSETAAAAAAEASPSAMLVARVAVQTANRTGRVASVRVNLGLQPYLFKPEERCVDLRSARKEFLVGTVEFLIGTVGLQSPHATWKAINLKKIHGKRSVTDL